VWVFPDMQKRLFMNIILWISTADLLASIASAFGFPNQGTELCVVQAFAVPFFYKASWLWTTVLSYSIYNIAFFGSSEIKMVHAHAFCWGVSFVTTVLPLTTNTFGRESDDTNAELAWCSLRGNRQSSSIWTLVTFNLLLLVVFVGNIYIQTKIYFDAKLRAESATIFAVLNVIILYPPGFLVTWGPNLVFSIIVNFGLSGNADTIADIFDAVSILATQSGTVFALIFFIKCKEARVRWINAVKGLCCGVLGEPTDLTQAISTINRPTDEDVGQPRPSDVSEFEFEDAEYRQTLEKQLAKYRAEVRLTETSSSLYGDDLNFGGRDSGISSVRISNNQSRHRISFVNAPKDGASGHNPKAVEEANIRGSMSSLPRINSNAESTTSDGDSGWCNYTDDL
jgi:hypothetical protein